MSYRIVRIRASGVGPADARYDRPAPGARPFEVSCVGPSGRPEDTIVWLENGGGKTVFLSLLFHVLRPDRAAQIGNDERGRRGKIDDFVIDRDVAHVAIEWVDHTSDDRLITGLVAHRRTGGIARTWYLLTLRDTDLGLDDLVFDVDGHRVSTARYLESVAELAAGAGRTGRRPRVELTTTDTQRKWLEALADHQLDPALFDYQAQMNRSEGGATSLFRFTTTERFIDFFLELTISGDTLVSLTETLGRVAEKIAKLPMRELEHAHASGALDHLERLASSRTRFAEASTDLRVAEDDAADLQDRLTAAVEARGTDERKVADELAATQGRRLVADRERRDSDARHRALAIAATDARLAAEAAALADAQAAHTDAELTARAWPRLELAADLQRVTGELETLEARLAAANRDAAPLRDQRDQILRRLRTDLTERITQATGAERDADERLRDAVARAATAAKQQLAHTKAAGAHQAMIAELSARVAAHDERLAAAIARGLLDDHDDPADAEAAGRVVLGDHQAAVERLRSDLVALEARLKARRRDATAAHDTAAEARLAATNQHELVEHVEAERRDLVDHKLLAELGGEGADLELVGSELTAKIAAVAEARRRDAIDVATLAAVDRRAADALATDRLLPPRPEVVELCASLHAAGVRSALPGWHHLAQTLGAHEWADAIAAAPALADGVTVAPGDLDRARDVLDATRPAAAVVVGVGAAFAGSGGDSDQQWVIPPDPAMFDRSEADSAADRVDARVRAADTHAGELAVAEAQARRLAGALGDHLEQWPPGALPGARSLRDTLTVQAEAAEAAEAGIDDELAALETRCDTTRHALEDAQAAAHRAELTARDLQALAADAAQAAAERARVAELTGRQAAAEAAARDAERDRVAADADAEVARRDGEAASRDATSLSASLARYPDPGPGDVADPAPFDTLDGRLAEIVAQIAERTTDSELARRHTNKTEHRDQLAQRWEALPALLRARVDELVAGAGGLSAADRVAAERRASHDAEEAGQRASDLAATHRLTQTRRKDLPAPDRAVDLGDLPDDLDTLDALVRRAEATRDAAADRRSKLDEDVRTLEGRVKDVGAERRALLVVANSLASTIGERSPRTTDPYLGDPEHAERDVAAATVALRDTRKAATEADQAWRAVAADIGVFARDDRWAPLLGDLARRLRNDTADVLARDVVALADDTRVLRDRLAAEIEELDTHRALLVTSLADAVDEAASSLRAAERGSRLPDGLGEWSHRPFLKIGLTMTGDAGERAGRLKRFANDLLERSHTAGVALPRGPELVRQAMLACTDRTVEVSVLKPNKARQLRYESITELASLSGGMRATAAIAMFCTLASIRTRNRSATTGVGTLILDNPIGDANAPYLVELQRLMASLNDVQLIYTTGVNDFDALRQFPVVVRLVNEVAKRSNLAYVRADDTFADALRGPAGTAPVIVSSQLRRIRPGLPGLEDAR